MTEPAIDADHRRAFRECLLDWFDTARRDMPWRETNDPYRIWLSEVMLQQTRVDQAAPYYQRFLERFPNVDALAGASLDEVLLCWEGLGYYSRARNLHEAARRVVDVFDGSVPDREEEIRSLPGVGPYTAAAVLSIAFGKPLAVLDGNVIRVLSRVFAVDADVKRSPVRKALRRAANDLLLAERPGDFNQAIMELGATMCTPRSPRCSACPLQSVCEAAQAGDPEAYPVKSRRKPVPHYDVAVGLIRNEEGQLLIQRRPTEAMLGGLWEFPGGKRKTEETIREACVRELREELQVEVQLDDVFCRIAHAYSHFRITLHVFRGRIAAGKPTSPAGLPVRWVSPSELDQYAFPRANRRLIERLARSEIEPSLFE